MKQILITHLFSLLALTTLAQNPFEEIGKEVEVLTLSNGKYPEFFPNDTLRRVGSVMFNTVTNKIEYFISEEQLVSEDMAKPYVVSRWLSRDPLAAKYPSMSPYNFVGNNPILFVDPDGREIVIPATIDGKTIEIKYIPNGQVPNGADEFTKNVWATLDILHNRAGQQSHDLVSYLVNATGELSEIQIHEDVSHSGSEFLGTFIKYDDETGLVGDTPNEITGSNKIIPAIALLHELDHAAQQVKLAESVNKLKQELTKAKSYGLSQKIIDGIELDIKNAEQNLNNFLLGVGWDKEENRVVSGAETEASKILGYGTRSCYNCWLGKYASSDPNTDAENKAETKERFSGENNKREKMLNEINGNEEK